MIYFVFVCMCVRACERKKEIVNILFDLLQLSLSSHSKEMYTIRSQGVFSPKRFIKISGMLEVPLLPLAKYIIPTKIWKSLETNEQHPSSKQQSTIKLSEF